MDGPRTVEELDALIVNRVPEDLHLDYKQSAVFDKTVDAVRTDLAKDVSAFANSDGGVIVFGIIEQDHIPQSRDSGVDHKKWNRERIEAVINANISPRMDGIEIQQIPLNADRSAYMIRVPKSSRGPHQERISHRYYKRFNFSSQPMEDYEIRDVRNRRDVVLPLISIDVDIRSGVLLHLVIRNISDIPAEDVQFKVTPDIPDLTSGKLSPNVLTRGSRFIPPGKEFRLYFGSAIESINQFDAPAFDVEVSYFNRRVGDRVNDLFHIDMMDYLHSAIIQNEISDHGKKIEKSIEKLCREVRKINQALEAISSSTGGTGLHLSIRTIRNLKHLKDGDQGLERVPASLLTWQDFQEVLNIDRDMAMRLYSFANWPNGQHLDEIDQMTSELADRVRKAFILDHDE